MKRSFLLIFIFASLFLIIGCSDDDNSSSGGSYPAAVADVDYAGAYNVVFFDFSTATVAVKSHTNWDLAIDMVDPTKMVANSGSYGSGVRVAEASGSYGDDFSSATVSGLTLSNDNILNSYQSSGKVYLVKDHGGTIYQVEYVSKSATTVTIRKADADGANSVNVVVNIDTTYGYAYLDLSAGQQVTIAPPKANWDVKFCRGAEFAMGPSVKAKSCVYLNDKAGVTAALVEQGITSVLDATGATFYVDPLFVGSNWYTYDHGNKVFNIDENKTWVVRTAEGNYAKFQVTSFYNADKSKKFYVSFNYIYTPNSVAVFTK